MPGPFLTRLTSDIGWTDYPAISLDGKMLAYASDRSGEGNLDIWAQQIPDGFPVRLTREGTDETEPSFSADGSRIAFRSTRGGRGNLPRPDDGRRRAAPGGARLHAALLAGREVDRLRGHGRWQQPNLRGSRRRRSCGTGCFRLHWAQAGGLRTGRACCWAQRTREAPPEESIDWYVVAVPGGAPRRTEARRVLLREEFRAFAGMPLPDAWVGTEIASSSTGYVGDSSNIWQVALDPESGQVKAPAQRVSFGTTDEAAASVTSDGRMVFISRTMRSDSGACRSTPSAGGRRAPWNG